MNRDYSGRMLRTAMALALLTVAANAAELTLEQGTLALGKQALGKPVDLAMKMAAAADALTGIQFDLEYDAATLDITVEAGPVAKQASKGLQSRSIQSGRLRVLIIGFNRTTIADGVLAVVHVSYKGTETGKTFPVRVTTSSGTNADAGQVAVTAKDGSIRVEK